MERGANSVSLAEGQLNYERFGAADMSLKKFVRAPGPKDEKDAKWRKLDTAKDRIEVKFDDEKKITIYPTDMTKLYYWEKGFWLGENCQDSSESCLKTTAED